ncbi:hypothetical protein R1flu_021979 [Riccia fluitans]|uniref:Uncharacterized protein n=1 Tax=Riccia fluitans TaxID=41844 RepID=A0ABD1ZQW7_9MARC
MDSGEAGIISSMNCHYGEKWKAAFARDCDLWIFEVSNLLDKDWLVGFLRRLKQVQLLDFFQRTIQVVAPRALILDFILESRVDRSSNPKGVLRYELQGFQGTALPIELTRETFAEILGLPTVESDTALSEYRIPKAFQASAVEWLGQTYSGTICKCPQMRISPSTGFAECTQCCSQRPETFWLCEEIKDSSIKHLIHFIGLWIHNARNTACLRRAAISSIVEALNSESARQIWTDEVWTNFLWTMEKLREAGSRNIRCESSFNTAGVISAILFGATRKLQGWNQAWEIWEKESDTPVIRTCREAISHVRMLKDTAAIGLVNGLTLMGENIDFMEEDSC